MPPLQDGRESTEAWFLLLGGLESDSHAPHHNSRRICAITTWPAHDPPESRRVMFEVLASTEIAASPRTVWSVLTDLRRFRAWNPFIRAAEGSTAVGQTVRVRVRSSFGLPLVFHATVLDSDENRELHWEGHVLAPWLARGEHWFTIEPIDAHRVRFVQRERFSGVLPRLVGHLLAREAKRGFEAMNAAMATRAELRADPDPDFAATTRGERTTRPRP